MIIIVPLKKQRGELELDSEAEFRDDDITQEVYIVYGEKTCVITAPNEITLYELLKECDNARLEMKEETTCS